MNIEIERKFLVSGDFSNDVVEEIDIIQAYLLKDPKKTIRIRQYGNKAFITIKGIGNKSGLSRLEIEKEISLEEAELLFPLCEKGQIEKTRNIVHYKGKTFEVDVFKGKLEGLIIAEIELESEDETFTKPQWLGKEVTGNKKYYNSYLSTIVEENEDN